MSDSDGASEATSAPTSNPIVADFTIRDYRDPDLTLTEEDVTRTPSSREDERHPPPAEPREDP